MGISTFEQRTISQVYETKLTDPITLNKGLFIAFEVPMKNSNKVFQWIYNHLKVDDLLVMVCTLTNITHTLHRVDRFLYFGLDWVV